MAALSRDYLKLSRWAEDYERRQGEIRCDQPVENNENRRKGQFAKYWDGDAGALHRLRKTRREQAFQVRKAEAANLSAYPCGQRQALQERHSQESQDRAREIAQGDLVGPRKEAAPRVKEEFERRAWERIGKAQQRREEERKRGRGGDSGRQKDR